MIRKADKNNSLDASKLAACLWNGSQDELKEEFDELLTSKNAAVFLKYSHDNKPIGFAQCSLRFDYVEGTNTSPVGYLEGIFVMEEFRKNGCGRELLAYCEEWAREQGCKEFASDCELKNTFSYAFHKRMGFDETNRIICFKKSLE